MKTKTKKKPKTRMNEDYVRGVKTAAAAAAAYDGYSSHTHIVSQCILAKLNLGPKPKENRFDKWLDGFAMALATVNRKRDQPSLIVEIMREAGLMVKDLRDARVEPYDVDEIARCMRRGSKK